MYKHLNTGVIAELIEKNELMVKMKVAETGEIKEIGSATFRRWWKETTEPEEFAVVDVENGLSEDMHSDYEAEFIPEYPTSVQDEPEAPSPDTDIREGPDAATEAQERQNDDKPLALSEIAGKLEGLFDTLNGIYFDGGLPRPVITIQSTPRAYGHCTTKKIWQAGDGGDAYYEINIGAEYL